MELNLLFTIALATVMFIVVFVLVGILIFYRLQLSEKNATLGRLSNENVEFALGTAKKS